MVPDKFSKVDLGGIDIVQSQGIEITGLYDRLVEAILLCRYQILYNWKFDGILIPPTYVEMEVVDDEVKINSYISVTSEDILHIYSIEHPAVLEELSVSENGIYTPTSDYDGFSSVDVDVQPTLESLDITENGTYTPSSGYDGFFSVDVDVQPTLENLEVTENGTYTPSSGYDGFSSVDVDVSGGVDEYDIIQPAFNGFSDAFLSLPDVYASDGRYGTAIFDLTPGKYIFFLPDSEYVNRFRYTFLSGYTYQDIAPHIFTPASSPTALFYGTNPYGSPDLKDAVAFILTSSGCFWAYYSTGLTNYPPITILKRKN